MAVCGVSYSLSSRHDFTLQVLIVSRSEKKLAAAKATLEEQGIKAETLSADFSDADDARAKVSGKVLQAGIVQSCLVYIIQWYLVYGSTI